MALPAPRTRNILAKKEKFLMHVQTWNIQGGIKNQYFAQLLAEDLIKQNTDIACLQETHCGAFATQTLNGGLITCLESDENTPIHKKYGLGFYVGPRMLPHYWGTTRITNRIAVIRFLMNNGPASKTYLSIINAYAPTALTTKKNIEETNAFYYQLALTYARCRAQSTITMIAGDFNAKLGLKQDDSELFMGNYGKGTRNENGQILTEFLIANRLFAANTTFEHKIKHRSTWHGCILNNPIHNQIDYLLLPRKLRSMLQDSRSIHRHIFSSDHSIVKTIIDFSEYYRTTKTRAPKARKWNLHQLGENMEARMDFQRNVNAQLHNINPSDTLDEQYQHLTRILQESADEIIPQPRQQPRRNTLVINYMHNSTVKALSRQQADLRHAIIRKITHKEDTNQIRRARRRLIKARRRTLRKLHNVVRALQNERINALATELDQHKGGRRTFEIARLLRAHDYQELKLIVDEDGAIQTNSVYLTKAVTEHYSAFFNQADIPVPQRWTIDDGALITFIDEITEFEVKNARKRLTNARAAGKDGTPGELYKYAPDTIDKVIADILNMTFISRSLIPAINEGILIAINKPNKPLTVKETRPITLLNSFRKILSLILLSRAYLPGCRKLPLTKCKRLPPRTKHSRHIMDV